MKHYTPLVACLYDLKFAKRCNSKQGKQMIRSLSYQETLTLVRPYFKTNIIVSFGTSCCQAAMTTAEAEVMFKQLTDANIVVSSRLKPIQVSTFSDLRRGCVRWERIFPEGDTK